jgi:hypothetical protein
MRFRTAIAAVIALCTAAFLLTGCEAKFADISGTVYAFTVWTLPQFVYTPLADADIDLIEGSATVDTQLTDASGKYSFAHVDPGTYTIRAYLDGLMDPEPGGSYCRIGSGAWAAPTNAVYVSPQYIEYSGLTVAAGDDVTVDFRLAAY